MKTGRNVSAIIAVVFLAGCALQQGAGAGGIDDGKADGWRDGSEAAVLIDESGDGQTFEVREGQLVVVRLPSNPSTGYDWEVISTDRTFGYPESTELIVDEPLAEGTGGVTELVWATESPFSMAGSHTVVLGYVRSWEEDVEPEETFTFTVDIVARRECDPVMCSLFCEHGFEVDEDGCEICVCAEAPEPEPECEPIMCFLYCEFGYVLDEDGCEICACVEAPEPECEPIMCFLYCEFGFVVGEDGCEVCACAVCPDPDDEAVHYVSPSLEECGILRFDCLDGEEPFSSPCGCGCIEI